MAPIPGSPLNGIAGKRGCEMGEMCPGGTSQLRDPLHAFSQRPHDHGR